MRRFVQDASHELRTPLVTIRGFSELYRHGALQSPEDVGAAMGRIESEAKRMGQLVDDLLTLARVDEQRPLEAKPLDLLLLGNDAALDARASAPDRAIAVVGLDGGAPRPAPILGDEARLRQVVGNLVTNALRYTPDGSPLEIAVGVQGLPSGRKRARLEVWLDELGRTIECLPWDAAVGRRWAGLIVDLKRRGRPMPLLDSMIAATALEHDLIAQLV
jgi:two-component system OmpR family sensor kinase